MGKLRAIAFVYMGILLAAASLNYIPGLTDSDGRAFGVFALDVFDDLLHYENARLQCIPVFTDPFQFLLQHLILIVQLVNRVFHALIQPLFGIY